MPAVSGAAVDKNLALVFFQTIGAAILVSTAQAAFINVLLREVQTTAPDISPEALISTGATLLRQAFRPDQLAGILAAYMSGLRFTFGIVLAAVVLAFLMSTYVPWWQRLGHEAGKQASPA